MHTSPLTELSAAQRTDECRRAHPSGDRSADRAGRAAADHLPTAAGGLGAGRVARGLPRRWRRGRLRRGIAGRLPAPRRQRHRTAVRVRPRALV